MSSLPRYLVDENGERVAVILPIDVYKRILEELEDWEDVHAFDEAKTSGEPLLPFEQVLARIEKLEK